MYNAFEAPAQSAPRKRPSRSSSACGEARRNPNALGGSHRSYGAPTCGTRLSWEEECATWTRPACATLWSACQTVASEHERPRDGERPAHWSAVHRFCTQAALPSPLPLLQRHPSAGSAGRRHAWGPRRLQPAALQLEDGVTDGGEQALDVAPQGPSARPRGETPLEVVLRLRTQIREAGGGRSRALVCVLGSTELHSSVSEELVPALVQGLVRRLGSRIALVTAGAPGVQRLFALSCGDGAVQVWNVLPEGQSSDYGVGQDVHAGTVREQCDAVFARLGDVYITLEGGPGVAAEAKMAEEQGALVVPLARTGGASAGEFDFPAHVLRKPAAVESQADWDMIRSMEVPLAKTVAATVSVVAEYVAQLEELPFGEAFFVLRCGMEEMVGTYARGGLTNGRHKYIHVDRPWQVFSFADGGWYLWNGLVKCYHNTCNHMGLPVTGWDPCTHGVLPAPQLRAVEAPASLMDTLDKRASAEGGSEGGHRPHAGHRSHTTPHGGHAPQAHTAPTELMQKQGAQEVPSSLHATKDSRLADLLLRGCLGLVRSSYFEDCMHYKRPLGPRQSIPSIHMWNGEEAVKRWTTHGKCFLCVVSYSWLSKHHPDPHLFHLPRLVRVLTEYKRLWGMQEVGVIFDYCSLWQPGPGDRDPRSEEQREQFEEALEEIVVPYAHRAITSIKLTDVPKGEKRSYDDRGWTLLESVMMDAKDGDWNRWVFTNFDPEIACADAYAFFALVRPGRMWPLLAPHRFKAELERRKKRVEDRGSLLFVQAKDRALVIQRYGEALRLIYRSTKLSYCGASWGDQEVELLAEVLPECRSLEKLLLAGNSVGPTGATSLARVIPKLRNLRQLVLKDNPLCNDGATRDMLRRTWRFESKPASGLVL